MPHAAAPAPHAAHVPTPPQTARVGAPRPGSRALEAEKIIDMCRLIRHMLMLVDVDHFCPRINKPSPPPPGRSTRSRRYEKTLISVKSCWVLNSTKVLGPICSCPEDLPTPAWHQQCPRGQRVEVRCTSTGMVHNENMDMARREI